MKKKRQKYNSSCLKDLTVKIFNEAFRNKYKRNVFMILG